MASRCTRNTATKSTPSPGARLPAWDGQCHRSCRCGTGGLQQTRVGRLLWPTPPSPTKPAVDPSWPAAPTPVASVKLPLCMPPCRALYSTGCQCAQCGTWVTLCGPDGPDGPVSPSGRTTKQLCRRRRYRPPSRRYPSTAKSFQLALHCCNAGCGTAANRATCAAPSTAKPCRCKSARKAESVESGGAKSRRCHSG